MKFKMKKKTKSKILTALLVFTVGASCLAIGANSDAIYDTVTDWLKIEDVVDETPGDETPGDETPGDETPGDETPGDDVATPEEGEGEESGEEATE